jgi:hypothetical protein
MNPFALILCLTVLVSAVYSLPAPPGRGGGGFPGGNGGGPGGRGPPGGGGAPGDTGGTVAKGQPSVTAGGTSSISTGSTTAGGAKPNVADFNLPAAVSPPSSVTLQSVFLGKGINSN